MTVACQVTLYVKCIHIWRRGKYEDFSVIGIVKNSWGFTEVQVDLGGGQPMAHKPLQKWSEALC
jgi:hypothetical protein